MTVLWARLGLRQPVPPASLPRVTIHREDGSDASISLPAPPSEDQESVLYFSLPKAGTTLLNGAMQRLARQAGLVHVDIPGELFRLGVSAPPSTSDLFVRKGYVYGFSSFPIEYRIPLLGSSRSVVMVRDPRDMLVSLYYSLRSSHVDPQGANDEQLGHRVWREGRENARTISIDEHALQSAPTFAALFAKQRELAAMGGARVFRYEDVIYRKADWIADICQHFGWRVPARQRSKIARALNVFPLQEQEDQHIRQVHPGNHKAKLQPATIAQLDRIFAESMAYFGYV